MFAGLDKVRRFVISYLVKKDITGLYRSADQ